MKRLLALTALLALASFRCSSNVAGGGSETGNSGVAFVQVETYDSPPPPTVEHLYLDIHSLEISHAELGWVTLSDRDTTLDYLELIGGLTAMIAQAQVPAGKYNQLRVVLADSNTVVVGGVACPLTIPSGSQSGIKIKLDLDVADQESSKVYIDLDIARSVRFDTGRCIMSPVLHALSSKVVGTLSGSALDAAGEPVRRAVVSATCNADTFQTLTRGDGHYSMFLPAGLWQVRAEAIGYTVVTPGLVDGVVVRAQTETDGLDFVLSR